MTNNWLELIKAKPKSLGLFSRKPKGDADAWYNMCGFVRGGFGRGYNARWIHTRLS